MGGGAHADCCLLKSVLHFLMLLFLFLSCFLHPPHPSKQNGRWKKGQKEENNWGEA